MRYNVELGEWDAVDGNWKESKKKKLKTNAKKKNCNGIIKIIAIKTERAKNNEEYV